MNGRFDLVNTGTTLTLTDPVGAPVSISGSTSSGLAELIAQVAATGFPGKATGSGVRSDGTCPAPFAITAPLTMPPMLGTQIDIDGTIIGDATWTDLTLPIIKFNTLSRCRFVHHGLIKISGSSLYQAIRFDPTDVYPANSFYSWQRKEIYGSEVRLGNIRADSAHASFNSAVYFGCTAAGFNNNPLIEIGEVMGGGYQYGVSIGTPDIRNYTYACFVQNHVRVGLIDSASVCQFSEGASSIDPAYNCLGTNLYELMGITTGRSATSRAVSISGVDSIFQIPSISVNGGAGFSDGIVFIANSDGNKVICPQNCAPSGHRVVNGGGSGNVVIGSQ